jgi:aspartyl-tRNA synthetase
LLRIFEHWVTTSYPETRILIQSVRKLTNDKHWGKSFIVNNPYFSFSMKPKLYKSVYTLTSIKTDKNAKSYLMYKEKMRCLTYT